MTLRNRDARDHEEGAFERVTIFSERYRLHDQQNERVVHIFYLHERPAITLKCTRSYFDRRVNLTFTRKDANLYDILRSWVQNDPTNNTRQILREGRKRRLQRSEKEAADSSSKKRARESVHDEVPSNVVPRGIKTKSEDPSSYLNTLNSVNAKNLLESHLTYMRAVRKWISTRRQRRMKRSAETLKAPQPSSNEGEAVISPATKKRRISPVDK